MGGRGDDPLVGQTGGLGDGPFGQVKARRADPAGEGGVGADQQNEAAPFAESGQGAGDGQAIGRAKMAVDDSCSRREAGGDRDRVRRSGRVGEEPEGGQADGGRVAIEPGGARS